MAVSTQPFRRRPQVPILLIAATIFAGVVAIMPIAAAVFSGFGGGSPRSAFASAPAGLYAVGVRGDETVDLIQAAGPDGTVLDIASVPHLRGYSSQGAVSPSGRELALVVADAGTAAYPVASLWVLDLESGALTKLADGLDYLQTPIWSPDGAVVVRYITAVDGPRSDVRFVRVELDGDQQEIGRVEQVAGAYAAGFDTAGAFFAVVIDERGSTLLRDMAEVARLSPNITRDWQLSEDGSQVAFIDVDVSSGLRYEPRVVSLAEGASGNVAAQSLGDSQALGVAWKPGSSAPEFGHEPGASRTIGGATAQSASAGFDVPLGYSPDGSALAVQHWSGQGFEDAGQSELQVITGNGRQALTTMTEFYGWARR